MSVNHKIKKVWPNVHDHVTLKAQEVLLSTFLVLQFVTNRVLIGPSRNWHESPISFEKLKHQKDILGSNFCPYFKRSVVEDFYTFVALQFEKLLSAKKVMIELYFWCFGVFVEYIDTWHSWPYNAGCLFFPSLYNI